MINLDGGKEILTDRKSAFDGIKIYSDDKKLYNLAGIS